MKRLLLFDIDGTLMHTVGAGRSALGFAMDEIYGETGDIDGFDFQGRTDPEIVRTLLRTAGFPDTRIDAGMARLWDLYCERLERELEARRGVLSLCPGVPGLLDRLVDDRRVQLGLVTGNVEAGAWRKLRAGGVDEAFGFGAFGSDSESRDELPPLAIRRAMDVTGVEYAAEEVVVIGDTPQDVRCARASGLRALAVATGGFTLAELSEHEPDAVLSDLADTDAVWAAIAG